MEDKTENYDAVAKDIFDNIDAYHFDTFDPLPNVKKFSLGFNAGVSYASTFFSNQILNLQKQLAAIVEDRDNPKQNY